MGFYRMNKKNGLAEKIKVMLLTLIMIISMSIVSLNFISEEAYSLESGIDAYGYNYTDSKEPNPKISYSWIDGITGGNATSLGDDENTDWISMDIYINYYGETYNQIAICSNGWVSFVDNTSTNNTPIPIPNFDYPFGVIAGFWTDLDPSAGGEVYYKSEADKFIITWWDVPIRGTSLLQRFEIVILDSNEILFQYMNVDMPIPSNPPFSWPGVGIEIDGLGEVGLAYEDVIENDLAIRFTPVPPMFPDNLAVTSSNLVPTNVDQGERDIPVLGLTLTANANAICLSSIQVNLTGSSTDADISVAKLWHDRNGNGIPEAIIDRFITSGIFFQDPLVGGYIAILGITLSNEKGFLISAGSPEKLIITYDISESATAGRTMGALVGIMYASGSDTVSGLPISSSMSTIHTPSSDMLSVICTSLQSEGATADQGEAMVPMALLTLSVNSDRVDIFSIAINLSYSTINYYEVVARVFHDVDDNGQFNAMKDIELGSTPFFNYSTAAINLLSPPGFFRVNSGVAERLIITYDFEYNTVIGGYANAYINSTYIGLSHDFPDTVDATGFPFTSNAVEVIGFAQPFIASSFTENPPTIDGQYASGEWAEATAIDLLGVKGNGVETIFQVMNDNETLYMVLDAVGDTTRNNIDVTSVSFDTNHDEIASPQEEDQFVMGGWLPSQTAHYVFDSPSTGWVIEDSPFNTLLPDHTNLAGDWGFDSSDNSGTWHRIYEYRIPLSLLGVPTPVPPRYTLGFAVGRQDNFTAAATPGTFDPSPIGTSNSTYWPMYYATVMENMSFMGDLILRAFNSPPELDWTGELGYVSDGVNPDSGSTATQFEYRIKYSDMDNDPPIANYPKAYIQKPCGINWGLSPYTMSFDSWVGAPDDYAQGAIYTYTTTLSPGGTNYAYYFNASDGLYWAIGEATIPCSDGPDVSIVNTPPTLDWTGEPGYEIDGVNPNKGDTLEIFEYRIKYSDFDNDPPAANYPKLSIEKPCSKPWGSSPYAMNLDSWVGAPGDYTQGAIFTYSTTLSPKGADYGYYFNATDTTDWAIGDPTVPCTDGPDVNAVPVLEWTGQPGFESDGVDPDSGTDLTAYEYKIKYSDFDNDPPAAGYPKLHVEKPCKQTYGGSPYTLNFLEWVGSADDYIAGAIYYRIQLLSSPGMNYAYYFNATDGTDWATGNSTVPCTDGPDVSSWDNPPVFEWTGDFGFETDGVNPDVGSTSTMFEYRVKYSDADNDPPALEYPKIYIHKPCSLLYLGPYILGFLRWVGPPDDYVTGAVFFYLTTLTPEATDYAYFFNATDGVYWAVGDPTNCTDGPDVGSGVPPPDAPPNLRVNRASPNVDLNWDPAANADEYRVYNSSDKFLAFGSWNLLGTTLGTNFQHINGMNGGTQYYIVRGYNPTGGEGPPSSMGVCAHRFFDNGGSDSSQHWISLPYNSMYKKASDITGELTEAKITVIGKWDSARQKSIIYWFFRGRWRGTDFAIDSGDGLWFRAVSDFDWYVNGTDKNVILSFQYRPAKRNVNWISLPYTCNYATASEVVAAIEGGTGVGLGSPSTKISSVVKWNPATQSEIRYEYDDATGWGGADFLIEPMEGIYLEVIADFFWQPELLTPPVPP